MKLQKFKTYELLNRYDNIPKFLKSEKIDFKIGDWMQIKSPETFIGDLPYKKIIDIVNNNTTFNIIILNKINGEYVSTYIDQSRIYKILTPEEIKNKLTPEEIKKTDEEEYRHYLNKTASKYNL